MRKDNSIYNKKQPGLYIYLYLQSQIPTSCYSGKKTIRHFHGKISPYFRFSKKNIFSLQLYKGDDTSNQQRNKLKDLIYIQENKPCSKRTVEGLFRSIVEPILEENTEALILCRLEAKSQKTFNSLLKRLEYSKAKVYDFSDEKFEKFIQHEYKVIRGNY